MQFGKPFSFVFDDPDWLKKIAMLALLGFAQLIPGIGTLFHGPGILRCYDRYCEESDHKTNSNRSQPKYWHTIHGWTKDVGNPTCLWDSHGYFRHHNSHCLSTGRWIRNVGSKQR